MDTNKETFTNNLITFSSYRQELNVLKRKPIPGCSVEVEEDNILSWRITLDGPPSTPYANGTFHLAFTFTEQYPFKAPSIKFITKIHHPNVKKETGEICNAIIADDWGPTLNVKHCVAVMKAILEAPDADNPFDEEIAAQMRDSPKEFEKAAVKCTKEYAMSG